MQNQMQGPMMRGGNSFGPRSLQDLIRNQAPGTVLDLETGLPPVRPPWFYHLINILFSYGILQRFKKQNKGHAESNARPYVS